MTFNGHKGSREYIVAITIGDNGRNDEYTIRFQKLLSVYSGVQYMIEQLEAGLGDLKKCVR